MSVNIVYSSSDAYAPCTGVSVFSLLSNNTDVEELRVYVLSSGISEKNKEKLRATAAEFGRSLKIIEAADDFEKAAAYFDLPPCRGSYSTYSRILMDTWLSSLERVMVIDADTLVTGSIRAAYETDMTDKVFAAVPELAVYSCGSTIEDPQLIAAQRVYYNFGIVVVNMAVWRQKKIKEKLKKELGEYKGEIRVADQSIGNRFLGDCIAPLPFRYNYYSPLHGTSYAALTRLFARPDLLSEQTLTQERAEAAILHFYGHPFERPWYAHSASPYSALYLQYRRRSQWANEPLQRWPKSINFVFAVYDRISYLMLRAHMYNTALLFRYRLGQRVKARTGQSRQQTN